MIVRTLCLQGSVSYVGDEEEMNIGFRSSRDYVVEKSFTEMENECLGALRLFPRGERNGYWYVNSERVGELSLTGNRPGFLKDVIEHRSFITQCKRTEYSFGHGMLFEACSFSVNFSKERREIKNQTSLFLSGLGTRGGQFDLNDESRGIINYRETGPSVFEPVGNTLVNRSLGNEAKGV